MGSARLGEPISMAGVRVHMLARGASFDLHTRKAHPADVDADTDSQ
jgi:hypothetical protein